MLFKVTVYTALAFYFLLYTYQKKTLGKPSVKIGATNCSANCARNYVSNAHTISIGKRFWLNSPQHELITEGKLLYVLTAIQVHGVGQEGQEIK